MIIVSTLSGFYVDKQDKIYTNIFDLNHPRNFRCSVDFIDPEGRFIKVMLLNVVDVKEAYYVLFTTPIFYSGAIEWYNAQIDVGSYQDCINIVRSLHDNRKKLSDEIIAETYTLFKFSDGHPYVISSSIQLQKIESLKDLRR